MTPEESLVWAMDRVLVPHYKVRPGGLLRCCLLTLDDLERTGHVPVEEEIKDCDYCKGPSLRFREGA